MAGRRDRSTHREAILAAARPCFAALGYDAVTIDEVIRASGLAAGTFHRHFADKEALFRALVDSRLSEFEQRTRRSRPRAVGIEDFFHDAYLGAFREVHADPQFFAMMLRNEPVLRALYDEHIFGLMLRSLNDDLRAAIARGAVPDVDVELLTAITLGAGHELCRQLVEQPQRDPEALARFVTRLFVDGLAGLQAAPTAMIRIGPRTLRGAAR